MKKISTRICRDWSSPRIQLNFGNFLWQCSYQPHSYKLSSLKIYLSHDFRWLHSFNSSYFHQQNSYICGPGDRKEKTAQLLLLTFLRTTDIPHRYFYVLRKWWLHETLLFHVCSFFLICLIRKLLCSPLMAFQKSQIFMGFESF